MAIIRDMKRKAYGFTIVELLIVIVVIGILAAVSIVAYNGINNRARVASASSALDQARKKLDLYKVENGSYPADLSTAGIASSSGVAYGYSTTNSNANFCLTATVGDISYYLDNDTKATPTEGGCNGHTWPGGVAMTNLVTNGDFSSGTSGWKLGGGWSISGGALVSTAPGSGQAYITIGSPPITQGKSYYMSATISSYTSGGAEVHLGGMAPGVPKSSLGSFSVVSVASGANGNFVFGRDANAFLGGIDYVCLIDLTAAFGAGKEPTKAQMDQIMNQFPNKWFNGTVTANTRGIL